MEGEEEVQEPKPLLELTKGEDGEVESVTVNFPDLKKSVTAPGDAVIKALEALNQWEQNRNIIQQHQDSSSQFP